MEVGDTSYATILFVRLVIYDKYPNSLDHLSEVQTKFNIILTLPNNYRISEELYPYNNYKNGHEENLLASSHSLISGCHTKNLQQIYIKEGSYNRMD